MAYKLQAVLQNMEESLLRLYFDDIADWPRHCPASEKSGKSAKIRRR